MEDIFRPWTLAGCFMTPDLFPPLLYYVRHGTSHTLFGPNGDIFTENSEKSLKISSRDELEMLVRGHLNWQTRGPSFFISTFFDKREAWRWALEREPMAVLYTIDTRRLPVPWPVVCAGVHTQNTLDSDFLFLSYIPSQAIIRIDTVRPHLPQGLASGDYSNPPTPPTRGFVPPPPPYVEPTPGPYVRFAFPPQIIASPPQYWAPQHFSSPPYTTPGRYITPVPPVEPPPQVPAVNETYATSEPDNADRAELHPLPASSSTSPPRTPPPQSTPGQIVEPPPQLLPQLQNESAVSELTVPSGTEPASASNLEPGLEPQPELIPSQLVESLPQLSPQLQNETTVSALPVLSAAEPPFASDPEPGVEPQPELNPEVDSEATAAPEPEIPNGMPEIPNGMPEIPNGMPWIPNGVPGTPNGVLQSLPIRLLQSNFGTPPGTGLGINFFATDYGETPESPRSEQAVNSNREAPATNGIHINGVTGTPNGVPGIPNGVPGTTNGVSPTFVQTLPIRLAQSNPGMTNGIHINGVAGTPNGVPGTPVQSLPVPVVQSNPGTPPGTRFGINFFATDYSETPSPESPHSEPAVNSNPEASVPRTNGFHINFFAEDY
ncbi:hypothetical protein QR685DRAFT_599637 [Neurospora intermedia]|uniref:DUF7587 domain-containing protein n=1 Tax=Neurospora intermedia TaxID=5142 RepID=A0ABR3D489_NEUIN